MASAGTQNAGLAAGGYNPGNFPNDTVACTEEYNGSTWSNAGALLAIRADAAGAGTQNAAAIFGGFSCPFAIIACTEEYDGTSWTAGGALITARKFLAGAGTQDSGLAFGGCAPYPISGVVTCTEEYTATPR
jgi:hypothetical protein